MQKIGFCLLQNNAAYGIMHNKSACIWENNVCLVHPAALNDGARSELCKKQKKKENMGNKMVAQKH